MRAYLAIKYHPDSGNRDRIERLTAALAACGVETVCIARDVEAWGRVRLDPPALMQASFDAIEASDVVVVDLTEKGVGIGIEAGYAFARNIPIVTLAEAGADISTTLRGISTHVAFYQDADDLRRVWNEEALRFL